MIGVFDSGAGGIDTVRHLRGLLPFADICYIADRKNAPYGTKSKNEIVALAVNNIKHLELLGAERVLIACCTASSVFDFLPERESISYIKRLTEVFPLVPVTPIIFKFS